MLQYALRHQAALDGAPGLDMAALAEGSTIAHFDASVVCKIFGYETIKHYYTGSRCRNATTLIVEQCGGKYNSIYIYIYINQVQRGRVSVKLTGSKV